MSQIKVFALGDSIVFGSGDSQSYNGVPAGWPARLKDKLGHKFEVINKGVPGLRIAGLTKQFNMLASAYKFQDEDILILGCGTNNALDIVLAGDKNDTPGNNLMLKQAKELLCTSPIITRRHLSSALDHIKSSFSGKIYFTGLLPVNEEQMPMKIDENEERFYGQFNNARMEEYNQVLQAVCNEKGVQYIDNWKLWRTNIWQNTHHADGLHPNSAGYSEIANSVALKIN